MEIKEILDKIICGDATQILQQFPCDCIDLTVTSPPYDHLRTYNGIEWGEHVWKSVIGELFRVTKPGGVVVWVVGDATIDGDETGTSFRQALYAKEIGFKLHDTMIYRKLTHPYMHKNRYYQEFEYMFVFSKGKPKTIHIQQTQKKASSIHDKPISSTYRQPNGEIVRKTYVPNNTTRPMGNVWEFYTGYMKSTKDKIAFQHPAVFPDKLAELHILSWSNENDIVLDPFIGSGTTAVASKKLNRHFIGIDINPDYCEIARKRLAELPESLDKFT
jgi:site-specific DNA-methyltransferase (adenine-specific)